MMEIVGAPIELKREFKNVDDFKLYYETHRDEFKNKKSNRLNKEYRIVGYKISNAKLDASNGEIKVVYILGHFSPLHSVRGESPTQNKCFVCSRVVNVVW